MCEASLRKASSYCYEWHAERVDSRRRRSPTATAQALWRIRATCSSEFLSCKGHGCRDREAAEAESQQMYSDAGGMAGSDLVM